MRRALLLLTCFVWACGTGTGSSPVIRDSHPAPPRMVTPSDDPDFTGLRMRLSDAEDGADSWERPPAARAEILPDPAVAALLARLPELEQEEGVDFAVRKGALPAPRTGETVALEFPPPEQREAPRVSGAEDGPLTVLRFGPEGDVGLAPNLSVTFSQPMVAVTGQQDAAKTVPAVLEPQPPGAWRWLGTRTLLFEPEPRFPMATEYRVRVPQGTESSVGGRLDAPVEFTLRTPPLNLRTRYPENGPHRRDVPLFLSFDQEIRAAELAPFVRLTRGSTEIPLRLMTPEETAEHAEPGRLARSAENGRWMALMPGERLPADSSFTVTLKKGAPSAEGPRVTESEQSWGFRTYAPLRIEEHGCSWGGGKCPPEAGWYVRFNNPLDDAAFDADRWRVEPEIPGLQINQSGGYVNLYGLKKGRTTYEVTVPGDTLDAFGQTLGKDTTLRFEVGPAEPRLQGPSLLSVLDPNGPAVLPMYTVNQPKLKVRIHRAAPEDWAGLSQWVRERRYDDRGPTKPLPGKEAFAGNLDVEVKPDELVETSIDLKPYLTDGYGQLIVLVEPVKQPKERWNRKEWLGWVQVTDIGLSAWADLDQLTAWATDLSDGKAAKGVEVSIVGAGEGSAAVRSDVDGLVEIPLQTWSSGPQILVGRRGADVSILPQAAGFWNERVGWSKGEPRRSLVWYVFDDRGLYKPGETVRFKGWIREVGQGKGGDVGALDTRPKGIKWTLQGPRGNEIKKGLIKSTAAGGFDLSVEIPDDINLGNATLQLSALGVGELNGTEHYHGFQVQEFRRPEFEVKASADPGPYVLGGFAVTEVTASYFAGGGLPGADVTWSVWSSSGSFRPPGWDGFSFGAWVPWWRMHDMGWMPHRGRPTDRLDHEATTDAGGAHKLRIDFEALNPALPRVVKAEATVMDVNRQAWTAGTDLLVHPAEVYVGLKTSRAFIEKGKTLEVEAVAANIDGEAAPGRELVLRFARLVWERKDGTWQEVEKDEQVCERTSGEAPIPCDFKPENGGRWRLAASVRDEAGRPNSSELTVWVSGGKVQPDRGVAQEQVELVPDKETYGAGDEAEIFVQSPFGPAEGVLTLRRSGLVETRRFSMSEATHVLRVPIREDMVPNLHLTVDLAGAADRTDDDGAPRPDLPKRAAYATGSLNLKIPPVQRTLSVTADAAKPELSPGDSTTVEVAVKDAAGHPVAGAEVVVVAVDEAVLALTGYRVADPIERFYTERLAAVSEHHLRTHLLLADPTLVGTVGEGGGAGGDRGIVSVRAKSAGAPPPAPAAAAPMDMNGGAVLDEAVDLALESEPMGGESAPDAPIALRKNFDALALWAPTVMTDASGRATVPLELPDSLTRYRITAVAVAGGKQFGKSESTVTARLPLMLRPSPPRFLNFGDRFELTLTVQNQTAKDTKVDLAVRGTNVGFGEGAADDLQAGRRFTVPANDRVEVRVPAAARMAGTARFQAVLSDAANRTDAAEFDLPVWTPATSEAFATYGHIDEGYAVHKVRTPEAVWPQFGGLEITSSSTALQALTDAFIYLHDYPFECTEQVASRILAVAALKDVLSAFDAEGMPSEQEITAKMETDLEHLRRLQNSNGGFGFWRRSGREYPYLGLHVAHALARAEAKGYVVPDQLRSRSLSYIRNIERHIPSWYSEASRRALIAYSVYVRRLLRDADPGKAAKLFKDAGIEELSFEALGWLLPTLSEGGRSDETQAILRHAGNRVTETAGAAHFAVSYSDGAHVLLHSDRRADAIMLEALIAVDRDSDLLPKIVTGLLAHRKKGRWANTQENVFVLVALSDYFDAFESQTPDFVARAWLGETYAGDHEFKGYSAERAHIDVPMSYLADGDEQPLILQRDGDAGRLYYRIGMRYAPKSLQLEPADYGFAVQRSYEGVDDPGDVSRDEDGTWRIKAGARVRVRLEMVAPTRRYHVALVDPLPAGLEPINPALAVSGTVPEDPAQQRSGYWWWWGTWYEHQNMRDERVEAFSSLVWGGVYEYTYTARATSIGSFVVPPSKAEEMYMPETFGRSGTDRVVVFE